MLVSMTAKCATQRNNSCYNVWHSTKDLVDAARQVKLDMRLKLDKKKRAKLERGALDEDSPTDDSSSHERASNSSLKEIGRLVVRMSTKNTSGPLDIIAHCADNSYRH